MASHDLQPNYASKTLFTIGYGNARSPDEFVRLLRTHRIRYLVDVRSKPFSKFRPEFSRKALAATLTSGNITYVYMGDALGGRPDDPTCYTDGKIDHRKVRERPWFLHGLKRLEAGLRDGHCIAIMCAELKPENCHRSKLVGETLAAGGVQIGHIDENGAVITHQAVMTRLSRGQADLFK
jgi:uncharacterized protein (DUF488 family)